VHLQSSHQNYPETRLNSPSRSLSPTLIAPGSLHDSTTSLDMIFIEGLTGETVIGIHESELHRPQPLVIDVHAGLPRSRACDTDRIGDTIDYSAVRERLLRLLAEHQLKLLEALAETTADILLEEFGASWVRVKIVKPRKFADVGAVGVQIERVASPVSVAGRSATVVQLLGSGMVVPTKKEPAPQQP
jgi:7,8-dihydroneopterin aldolase/epimerase/oxygenase